MLTITTTKQTATKTATLKCMLCLQRTMRSEIPNSLSEEAQAKAMQTRLKSVPDAVSTTEHGGALCLIHFMEYNK